MRIAIESNQLRALASANVSSDEPSSTAHGIKADLLIPGRGQPLKHGAVVIDGKKIVWVGSQYQIPAEYKTIPYVHVPVVLPGLWDCHVHLSGTKIGQDDYYANIPLAAVNATTDLLKCLNAGFTSVREVGGIAGYIAPAINDGDVPGPNVYSSFGVVSMTAGHGDNHNMPLKELEELANRGYPSALADGPDGCTKIVRLQLRKGAHFIKICASGGVGSLYDDPQDRQFSDAELKAIVDEASRARRLVAAHCHGKDGMIAALNAGIKTIEHGSYMDEEVVELMKEKGAILVATRLIVEQGLKMKEAWSPTSYEKLKAIAGVGRKGYALAIREGVKIALGTDTGISGENPLSLGQGGQELVFAVESGMTPLQAIEAATATAPETLGKLAPLSGLLKEGYDADLIAVSTNPLEDIEVIAKPKNVTHVWKGGKLFKSPHGPAGWGMGLE